MPMQISSSICAAVLALLVAMVARQAEAEPADYPAQRITFLVGFAPGGPVDVIARIVADGLQKRWHQSVVVENRPGAGGNIAAATVGKAAPDGYTLLFTATGVAINQSLYAHPGYSIKDLAPISIAAGNSLIMAVNPDNPARTLQQFFTAHRTEGFTFGTAGTGSGAHITSEYVFRVLAKVPAVHTPFQGSPRAVTALLGNHIDFVTVPFPDAVKLVQEGKLRALAVTSATRLDALPEVPTIGEAGFPQFESSGWIALLAPAKVPPAIIEKLNNGVNETLGEPQVKARLDTLGFNANRASLSDTQARLAKELANWSRMVEAIGLKIN
jgi:tripartite-type tricarboxylate transporter receptor subunit TctC